MIAVNVSCKFYRLIYIQQVINLEFPKYGSVKDDGRIKTKTDDVGQLIFAVAHSQGYNYKALPVITANLMDRAYKIDGAVGIYTVNPWDFSVNTEHPSAGNMQKIYVPYHVFRNYKFV